MPGVCFLAWKRSTACPIWEQHSGSGTGSLSFLVAGLAGPRRTLEASGLLAQRKAW